jgi:hypothetical protein
MLSDAGLVYPTPASVRCPAGGARLEQRESEGYGVSYEIAIIHAALGQIPEACAALRHAPDDPLANASVAEARPEDGPAAGPGVYAEVMQALWHSP